jgi:hypothetical protein
MVNVEAAAPGPPTNPRTLNFRFAFTACCGTPIPPEGCPPDLPPIFLIFGISPDPNEVLQYDVTDPGVNKARLLSAGFLGSGTITYAPTTFDSSGPSAIYNWRDDKMYFTATKTDSVGPVVTSVLVQFDPRTLSITGEIVLPSDSYTLIDVADQSAWLTFDGSVREFDLVSFTEIFNDSGAISAAGYTVFPAAIACNSGQLLLSGLIATSVGLLTVTGPTTFTISVITVPNQGDFSENGQLRRRWIMDRNKVIIPSSTGPAYLIDLNDFSTQIAYAETANTISFGPGPYWDPYLHLLIGNTTGSGDFGRFVGDDTGGTVGIAGLNNGDWSSLGGPGFPQTSGGLALAQSNLIDALGGFDETVISFTPSEIYERTDGFTFPGGQSFNAGNLCVAIRRKDCTTVDQPQRGGAQWESPVFRGYVPFGEGFSPQTITDTQAALQYFNAIDTAGWFNAAVGSVGDTYTPLVRGYYVVTFGITAQATTASAVAFPTDYFGWADLSGIQGTGFPVNAYDQTSFVMGSGTDIVHCNGTTDAIQIKAFGQAGWTWDVGADLGNANGSNYFNVWLLKKD